MMNKKKEFKENDLMIYIIGLISVCIIIGLWYYTYLELKDLKPEDRGTLGDMFGTINSLFSGLAFGGIIFTILLQRKELKLQRNELIQTRTEFKINRLTNILFKQIEYMNRIIESAKFGDGTVEISKLVNYLENHKGQGELERMNDILKKNSRQISKLITEVLPIMKNFEEILNASDIEKSELLEMKQTFFKNTNPHFLDLLLFKIHNLKLPDSADSDINDIEMEILKLEIQKAQYIVNYANFSEI